MEMLIKTDNAFKVKKKSESLEIEDKKKRTSLLIDMSVPPHRKETPPPWKLQKKLSKWKELESESEIMHNTWGAQHTPVVIDALGFVKKEM